MDAQPVVIAVRDAAHADDAWRLEGCETLLAEPSGPGFLAYSSGLSDLLANARLDLLHLHGIWQYPSHAAARWARATGRPLVISPHGMLAPWITQHNAWKKHLGRLLWERRAWRRSAALHALTQAEAQDIAHETGGARIAIIPNVAPAPSSPPTGPRPPVALYLGRIHEKKNIAALIAGWLAAQPDLPEGAMLTIAGWGDDEGIAMLEQAMAGDHTSIEFVGAAFGSQKAALFDIARFCVLPSLSEGLPMVVLEAWAAGVPTIMSEHCHLPEGFAAGAALRCGTESDDIRAALVAGFAHDDGEWQAMSDAAQSVAQGSFGAPQVQSHWEALYAQLIGPQR
ncbi:glycosyltransferase [Qipengyuania marisflavi]|uniref:Glycosyltransferase n=2 Tax=Qipengyuania marisflavi TaxID=2486356 RepID=A0A5S3PAB7_9SPHN|nr:glycosyltransferase [Qipengyuania marisflavi]